MLSCAAWYFDKIYNKTFQIFSYKKVEEATYCDLICSAYTECLKDGFSEPPCINSIH